jgi:hypothetical protein
MATPESIMRAALEDIAAEEDHGYGFWCGGDPRKFHPDAEDCTAEELAAHKAACEAFDKADALGEKLEPMPCQSGWIGPSIHITKSPFGIGSYTFPSFAAQKALAALGAVDAMNSQPLTPESEAT